MKCTGLWTSALLLLLAGTAVCFHITVQLQSLELNGNLEDGSPCSSLAAFGIKCYPLTAICIERATNETADPNTCETAAWINLGTQPNMNTITFDTPAVYGGWNNAQQLQVGSWEFAGFYVKLRVQNYYATTVKPIANAAWRVNSTEAAGPLNPLDLTAGNILHFKLQWTLDDVSVPTTTMPMITKEEPTSTSPPTTTTVPAGEE